LTAQAAGLRYVSSDDRPGLRRCRTGRPTRQGKRLIPNFRYLDTKGQPLSDPATLTRIRKLAIPPAWDDVWICADANGHLQATGRDARGRKQYRYHPRWRQERDSTKYSRMIDFGRALPALRRRVTADLRLPGLPRRKVLATVVKLLETTFIRVGNEEYARSNHSFGLTTLKNRHVEVHASDVRFHFRGKSGVYHEVAVHDPRIARIVRRCRHLPGQELFQYLDDEGNPTSIDSADVNEYIRDIAGHDFTAKDFRTWAGTVLAAAALREVADVAHGAAPPGGRRTRPNNKDVVRAVERVAERLGNTPSVCRKCYVHPQVIAAYLDGTLASALQNRRSHGRGATGLAPNEAAVLSLLRRRQLAENKGETPKTRQLARQLTRSLRLVRNGARRRGGRPAPGRL
jgi:DNA topoisomerase-1